MDIDGTLTKLVIMLQRIYDAARQAITHLICKKRFYDKLI
jgi:hypothetical protein